MYATLLERYNPGMGMDEEERGEYFDSLGLATC